MSTDTTLTRVPDRAELADLGRLLAAMGDPIRQRILMILSRERLNVGQLSLRFGLSRPAISHQLRVLADSGLLRQQRDGREHVYRVDASRCRGFVEGLRDFVSNCCAGSECLES